MNLGQTVWSVVDRDSNNDDSAFEYSMVHQLADAGVFKRFEKQFAQKPVKQLKSPKAKGPVQVLDSKKAYTMSKFKLMS